jgi:hypothetical protein
MAIQIVAKTGAVDKYLKKLSMNDSPTIENVKI